MTATPPELDQDLKERIALAGRMWCDGEKFSTICEKFKQTPPTVMIYILGYLGGEQFDWHVAKARYDGDRRQRKYGSFGQ